MIETNSNAASASEFPLDDTRTDLPTLAVVKAPKVKKAKAKAKAKAVKPKLEAKKSAKPKSTKKVKAVKKIVKKAVKADAPTKIKIKRVKLAKKAGRGKGAIVTYVDESIRLKIQAAAKQVGKSVARYTREVLTGQFA